MGRSQDSLGEYRRKRDFSRTAEPSGRKRRQQRESLAFVIQKHAASHLHYDLRLELDGVMKSWAVPRGPSLDPAVRRLAMQVEDHPIEYNTFEGTIPKGEYGGGTVMLWDRGSYAPDETRAGEGDAAAVRRGLRAGKLSFSFRGERLHGSFALIRTEAGAKPKWLLLKHRDEHADPGTDITEAIATSVATGRTMDEIAAEADRVWRSNRSNSSHRSSRSNRRVTRGGADAASEAAASHTRAAGTIAPMKPKPVGAAPQDEGWCWEPWHGGMRVVVFATADGARLFDAAARDVTRRARNVAAEAASLAARVGRPFVAEGELVDDDDALVLADLLLDGDTVLLERPARERRRALQALLRRRRLQHLQRQEYGGDPAAMMARAERRGWPGIIGRRDSAGYQPGSRSDDMLRISVR